LKIIHVLALAGIQGLTEFLPISSSGHLVLMQNLLGMREPELLLDICLHVGTLVSVGIVFWPEICHIIVTLVKFPALMRSAGGLRLLWKGNEDVRIVGLILAGSVPTAILGILFREVADQIFGAVWIVGLMLLVTGSLLWLTRRAGARGRPIQKMRITDAVTIGLIQGVAILPGISRSGSTISAALFLGIDRELAGRYSFLLSIPAIMGALVLGLDGSLSHNPVSVGVILTGIATAALVGYGALIFLLRMVKKGKLYYFAPYCWLLGLAALVWDWL
jgi:undecaprenyl-diphosphatase